jgi:uncharacterized membrane protein
MAQRGTSYADAPAPLVARRASALARVPFLAVVPLAIPVTLYLPMALNWSPFSVDWANHLYLLATMEHSLRTLGHPSFFIHSAEAGLYYPIFAFYGGTVYSLGGLLGIVLGSPTRAYMASYGIAFAMTYGGMYWIARLTGLRGLLAHVPAVVAITGAYYLTDAYARGAWPELMAISAIPPLVASIAHVLSRPCVRVLPLLVVYASGVLFSGSHNITLLWGTIVLVAVSLVVAAAVGVRVIRAYLLRVSFLLGVLALSIGTNLWFLLPDLAYTGKTVVARQPHVEYLEFDKWSIVFSPWHRTGVPSAPTLFVQVSIYVLAWSLVVLAIAAVRRVGSRRDRTFTAGLVAVLAALLILVVFDSLWNYLPSTLLFIQFPYRLQSYILFLVAGIVLMGVHAALRMPHARLAFGALAVALTCQIVLAERQAWMAPHTSVAAETYADYAGSGHVPPSWYGIVELRIATGPPVTPTGSFALPPQAMSDDRILAGLPAPAGDYETNVVASPFVHITGAARAIGYSPSVFEVVRKPTSAAGQTITVQPTVPTPELIGVIASVLSPLAVIAICIAVWWRGRRRRGSAPTLAT